MNEPIVIVGSGFAARSVASRLPIVSTLLLERGEYRSHEQMIARYDEQRSPTAAFWQNARHAYASDSPENATYALSDRCFSQFEFIGGGSSNRWSGTATPLTRHVFDSRGDGSPAWAISYEELWPYYVKAADVLDVSIDPADSAIFPGRPEFHGADYWRSLLEPRLGPIRLRSEAKNVRVSSRLKSRCCGAGNCEICPEDAKSRPDNTFDHALHIEYMTKAVEIEFEGRKATAVICDTNKGRHRMPCRAVVVAANAIESVSLLKRSRLPVEVPRHLIGLHYHDHAVARLIVQLPNDIRYRYSDTNVEIELGAFTKVRHGLESLVYAMPAMPDRDAFAKACDYHIEHNSWNASQREEVMRGVLMVGITLEMPPELGIAVDYDGRQSRLRDEAYKALVPRYDAIVDEIANDFRDTGIPVLGVTRWYRESYGCHHLMGTLAMANPPFNATTPENLLTGTNNCFVAGSSLIPRAGAKNPTLTLTALGLRLGDYLARRYG